MGWMVGLIPMGVIVLLLLAIPVVGCIAARPRDPDWPEWTK